MEVYNTNIIKQLISPWNSDKGLMRELESFANYLGWYPSDIIEDKRKQSITTGHLFVEHGLENSAVISFINNQFLYNNLNALEKHNLLGISYNNLVDLHISVDRLNISGIHNRMEFNNLLFYGTSDDERNLKSSTYSEILQELKVKPIYKQIDDSIIDTLSYWKRIISSELNNKVDNEKLSNFFNSIILLRAIEDYDFSKNPNSSFKYGLNKMLDNSEVTNYTSVVKNFLTKYNISNIPKNLLNLDNLMAFDSLNVRTLYQIFQDFYRNKYSNYEYDFSIMSKHTLSRLYEKYVSILEIKQTQQLSFLSPIPEEKFNKNSGSYYTPQFIARFFTKFLESNITDIFKKNLRILEPAVGSGIFIRTFLERQIEVTRKDSIEINLFNNVIAVDKNPTACNAANLSMSLLHLVSYDKFPEKELNILNQDSLLLFKKTVYNNKIDIIISNPPYIKYNALDASTKKHLKELLGVLSFGKTDLYIAFLKIALDSLKDGGYGCFVLPNTFLSTDSAKNIRKEIFNSCCVKCIVDLSDIKQRIFEEVGVYPILFIFQKTNQKSNAIIAKIQDNTGQAIHHVLNKDFILNDTFSVYEVDQTFFKDDVWYLLPPTEFNLKQKFSEYPKIEEFFDVRTGFASGDVDAFIFHRKMIPKGEEKLFVPYLEDREMKTFISKTEVDAYFFYPFIDNLKITEEILKNSYQKTYNHLKKFEDTLSQRTEVKKGKLEWWMPNRPRSPKFMLVPKILTPHLVFTPRFNIDREGKFAVSRSPFLVPKFGFDDPDLLYYFTGILNSSVCFWYLLSHAPKYQNGFAMLEPTYLKNLPVPNPYTDDISKRILVQRVITLVKQRIIKNDVEILTLEKQIDNVVAELFNLNSSEKHFLNI